MLKRNIFGFITEIQCPFCGSPLHDEPWNGRSEQTLICPSCGGKTTWHKSKEREEWEKRLQSIEPSGKGVLKEQLEQAVSIAKYFHCKKGWYPKYCMKALGCSQSEECQEYLSALALVKDVKEGRLTVISDERAWQL